MSTKINIETAPGAESLRPWLERLAHEGVPSDATEVYHNRRNKDYRCTVAGQQLNIKAFGIPRFPNRYIYGTLRKSKARRSLENALRLCHDGFATPKPIAYVEVKTGCTLTRSYYISQHVDMVCDMRDWDRNPEADAAVADLAALIAHLHDKGVFHKDMSPGNVMVVHDSRGNRQLMLIDLNRMDFGHVDHRHRMLNFERIYPSNAAQTERLARLYARAADLDEDDTARRAEQARRNYIRRHERKKRLKRLLHPGKKQ